MNYSDNGLARMNINDLDYIHNTEEKNSSSLHSHSPPQSRAVLEKDNEAVNIAMDSEKRKI